MPSRSLSTYQQKRHFGRTAEPRGEMRRRNGFQFVVQKHAARALHYDFRLELDGVLLSWAIPKGPSLDPAIKRMAVQTEDHPIEYGTFEGVIPKGEYGGGTVAVWDRGKWIPDGDPRADYERGRLTFRLEGEKLHGGFHLVRTKRQGKAQGWLLIKRNDEHARRERDQKVIELEPESVLSGRSLEQIASDPDRVWHSNREQPRARTSRRPRWPDAGKLPGARKAKLPDFIEPQLATLASEAPEGDDWLHEIKLDGYRMIVRCKDDDVRWLSRRGHDWSERVPSLSAVLRTLQLPNALLDGELVVLHEGVSSFQRLQNSLQAGRDGSCVFFAFDVPYFGGYDLRAAPLLERKRFLSELFAREALVAQKHRLRLSEHVVGRGEEFFAHACQLGVEGSVCKRASARYVSGRSTAWLKVKCTKRQEFVIGGFTAPSGARRHFGALLLGVQGEDGLQYAGRVGTGFSDQSLAELERKLSKLERKRPPFVNPPKGADARGVRWVEPKLIAEVQFTERTQDGLVRHASFQGLREDKSPAEVRDDRAVAPRLALPSVRLTHPDRVLYADQGITKADLALYYAQVAERMLPHLANRPLMVVRCPEGQGAQCFHQKHPGRGLSKAVKRIAIEERDGEQPSMYVEDVEGLLQLVQIGALEIHTWGSRIADVERPDQLTFDLDPDEGLPWPRVIEAAQTLRQRLQRLGLHGFLKTTGGKGLHIVVPIVPSADWDAAKPFCKGIAEAMARREPDKYVVTISKAKRKGKLLIDYLRNGRGATAVCAYSTRARANAPVAMPIAWDELDESLRPDQFTLQNVRERLAAPDPWADYARRAAALDPSMLRRVLAR